MPGPEPRGEAMRRREFIRLVSGAAAAWPFTVHAQQSDRMRRIGVLTGTRAEDPEVKPRRAAFEQALQQLGWTPGRNVRIDYRFAGGDAATSRSSASKGLWCVVVGTGFQVAALAVQFLTHGGIQ